MEWAFWPRYNLGVGDVDFYKCDTSQPIVIAASVSGFPDELLKESKFALYQRGLPLDGGGFGEDDDPKDGRRVLTVRLTIGSDLEPSWEVIKNNREPKRIGASDRAMIPVCVVGSGAGKDTTWGRHSLLQRYATSNSAMKSTSIEALRRLSTLELSDLDAATAELPKQVESFGVNVSGDSFVNRFLMTGAQLPSQAGLFDGDAPLALLGTGSRRLFSIAMGFRLSQNGSLVLVDEIESGLEPHRLCNLIQLLRAMGSDVHSHVIFTTHSPVALREMQSDELYAFHCLGGIAQSHPLASDDNEISNDVQAQLRKSAESFLAKRVVVCEGSTEVGVLRAIDCSIREKDDYGITAAGVAPSDAGGGKNMFKYARHFKDAGYDVCIFMDSDKPYEDDKKAMRDNGISVFDCDEGLFLEQQVFTDVDFEGVRELLYYVEKKIGKQRVGDQLRCQGLHLDEIFAPGQDGLTLVLRQRLGKIAGEKGWFKSVTGGEILGTIALKHLRVNEGPDGNTTLANHFAGISRWAIGQD
ncbi:MAG TPA: hypothetical protein DDZ84_03285 [Firmicutes bacterium]|nr:hypothetical protein [Bacillota bacterium]